MINIIKKYKQYRKIKYEKLIKKNYLFNEWRIENYKNYPNKLKAPLKEFEGSFAICYCCDENNLKFYDKIGVDKSLSRRFYNSDIIATKEYKNLENKLKEEKVLKEEKEKIKLYKKAILELKQEGKI